MCFGLVAGLGFLPRTRLRVLYLVVFEVGGREPKFWFFEFIIGAIFLGTIYLNGIRAMVGIILSVCLAVGLLAHAVHVVLEDSLDVDSILNRVQRGPLRRSMPYTI